MRPDRRGPPSHLLSSPGEDDERLSPFSRKALDWAVVVPFLAVICMPMLLHVFVSNEAQLREKRTLASRPEFSVERLLKGTYCAELEQWLNDHFGGRPWIVSTACTLAYRVQKRMPGLAAPTNGILIGYDGWIFLQNTFEDRHPAGHLHVIARNLYFIDRFVKRTGRHFVFMLVPDKNRVYPEMIPARHRRDPYDCDVRLLNRLLRQMDVCHVDLYETFARERRRETGCGHLIYSPFEDHWTGYGTELAARQLVTSLDVPELTAAYSAGPVQYAIAPKMHNFGMLGIGNPAVFLRRVPSRSLDRPVINATDRCSFLFWGDSYLRRCLIPFLLCQSPDDFSLANMSRLQRQYDLAYVYYTRDIPGTLDQVLQSDRELLVVETAERALGRIHLYVKDLAKSRYAEELFEPMTVCYDSATADTRWQGIGSVQLRQTDGRLLVTCRSGAGAIFSAGLFLRAENSYAKIVRIDVIAGTCVGLDLFAFDTDDPSPATIAETSVAVTPGQERVYVSLPPQTRAIAVSPIFAGETPTTVTILRIVAGY